MIHNESSGIFKIVIYKTHNIKTKMITVNSVLFYLFYIYTLGIFYNPSYQSTNDLQFSI